MAITLETMGHAAPEIKPADLFTPKKLAHNIAFPASIARVESSHRGDSDELIYLIQDAHTNDSGQLNLARVLELLLEKDKDLKHVYVEGGFGDVSLSYLRSEASVAERRREATAYLRKGLLHGEEYLDLTSERDFTIWGVEDPALYRQAIESYAVTAKARPESRLYLGKIGAAIDVLKGRIWNKRLLDLQDIKASYLDEKVSLTDYLDALQAVAKQEAVSLHGYPHIASLNEIHNKERAIDFARADQEHSQALGSLSASDRERMQALVERDAKASKYDLLHDKGRSGYFALLEEILGKDLSRYPELNKYLAYLHETRSILPEGVLADMGALESALEKLLSMTRDERVLLECQRTLRDLEKLSDLSMTPSEYRSYEEYSKTFTVRHLTGFLNRKLMELGGPYERATYLEEAFDETVKQAESFYRLTVDRDEAFMRSMTSRMEREGARRAVLITGGYHTPNLKRALRQAGTSYISIQPQVYQETSTKKYESVLLGQKDWTIPVMSRPAMARTMAFANTPWVGQLQKRLGVEVPEAGARLAVSSSKFTESQKRAIRRGASYAVQTIRPDLTPAYADRLSDKLEGMVRVKSIGAHRLHYWKRLYSASPSTFLSFIILPVIGIAITEAIIHYSQMHVLQGWLLRIQYIPLFMVTKKLFDRLDSGVRERFKRSAASVVEWTPSWRSILLDPVADTSRLIEDSAHEAVHILRVMFDGPLMPIADVPMAQAIGVLAREQATGTYEMYERSTPHPMEFISRFILEVKVRELAQAYPLSGIVNAQELMQEIDRFSQSYLPVDSQDDPYEPKYSYLSGTLLARYALQAGLDHSGDRSDARSIAQEILGQLARRQKALNIHAAAGARLSGVMRERTKFIVNAFLELGPKSSLNNSYFAEALDLPLWMVGPYTNRLERIGFLAYERLALKEYFLHPSVEAVRSDAKRWGRFERKLREILDADLTENELHDALAREVSALKQDAREDQTPSGGFRMVTALFASMLTYVQGLNRRDPEPDGVSEAAVRPDAASVNAGSVSAPTEFSHGLDVSSRAHHIFRWVASQSRYEQGFTVAQVARDVREGRLALHSLRTPYRRLTHQASIHQAVEHAIWFEGIHRHGLIEKNATGTQFWFTPIARERFRGESGARLAAGRPEPSTDKGAESIEGARHLIENLKRFHSSASKFDVVRSVVRRLLQSETKRIFVEVGSVPYASWLPVIVFHWIDDVLDQGAALHVPWVLKAYAIETLALFERDLDTATSRAQQLMRSTVLLAQSMYHLHYDLLRLLEDDDWTHVIAEIQRERLNDRPEITHQMLRMLSEELLRQAPDLAADLPRTARGARLAGRESGLSRAELLRRFSSPEAALSDAQKLKRLAEETVREVYERRQGQLDADYIEAFLAKVKEETMRRSLVELYGDRVTALEQTPESASNRLLRLSAAALDGRMQMTDGPIALIAARTVGRRGFLGLMVSAAAVAGLPGSGFLPGAPIAGGAQAGSSLFQASQVPSELITDHLLRMIRHFMDPRTVHVGGFGYQQLAGVPIRPFWNAKDLSDGLAAQRAYFLEQLPQTIRLLRPDVQAWVEKSAAGFPSANYGPLEWRYLDSNPFAPAFKEVLGQARVLKNSVLSLSGTTIQELRTKEIFSDPGALDAEEERLKNALNALLPLLWEAERAEEKVWGMEGYRILTPRQRERLDQLTDLDREVTLIRQELESIRRLKSVIGTKRSIAEAARDEQKGARLSASFAQEPNYIGSAVRIKPGEARRALNVYLGAEGRVIHVANTREELEAGQSAGFYTLRMLNGTTEYLDRSAEPGEWIRYDFLQEMQVALDPNGRLYLIERDLAERLPAIGLSALRGDPVVQSHRGTIAEIAAIARKYPVGTFVIHTTAGEQRLRMNEMRAGDRAIQQLRQIKGDSVRIQRLKKDGRFEYHVWPLGARLAEEGGRPESLRIEDVIRRQGYENGSLRVDYRVGMRVGVVADVRALGVAYVEVPHEWRVLLAKITKIDRKNGTVNYRFLDQDEQVIQSIPPQRAPIDADHLGEWVWKGDLSGARLAEVRKYSEYQARGMDFGPGRVFHRRAGESTIIHPDGVTGEMGEIRIEALSLNGGSAQIRIGGRGFSPRTVSLAKGQALEWVGDERIALIMTGVRPSRMTFVLVRPSSWRVRQENGRGARLSVKSGVLSDASRITRFQLDLVGLSERFKKRHDLTSKERRMIQGLSQSALDLHRSDFARRMPRERRRQWFEIFTDIRSILNYQNEALAPLAVRQLETAHRKLERILDSHDGRLVMQPEAYLSVPAAATVSGIAYSTLQWALDRGALRADAVQSSRKGTSTVKSYFFLKERVERWAKLRETIMTTFEIAPKHLTAVLKVIDESSSDQEAEKIAAERLSPAHILREALRERVGRAAIRVLAEETGLSTDTIIALKRRPDIAALFEAANSGTTAADPSSGARLAEDLPRELDRFFVQIAGLFGSSAALAMETEERIRVYTLLRQSDKLVVTYEDPEWGSQKKVYDLTADRLRQLDPSESADALRSEDVITDHLERVMRANSLTVEPAFAPSQPVRLVIHLDSLESFDKAVLSNLFYHWKAKLGPGSVVVLEGSELRLAVAERVAREMALKNIVAEKDLSADQRSFPDAHLVTQGYLGQNPSLRIEHPSAKWLFLERVQGRDTAVFGFAPIGSLLELVARGQTQTAFSLYTVLAPQYRKVMTYEDFLGILGGDEALAVRFPLPALLKVDFREAVRLYRLSRMSELSA